MEKRPNIIILILDAVRACSVSAYGYSRPTHTSLLTGLYPAEHGIQNIESKRLLHKSIVPLQTALRHAGHHAAAFSQNILFSPGNHFNDFAGFHEPHAFTPRKRAASGRRTTYAKRGQLDARRRYFSKVRGVRVFADGLAGWITAQTAVIDSRHKRIKIDGRSSEFYNLEVSPFESEDPSLSEKIAAWRAILHIFPPRTLETTEPMDPELQERLSLLGYLD